MKEISDIPEHIFILGGVVIILLLLSIPVLIKTMKNSNNISISHKKISPKGSLILFVILSIIIYSGCYVQLIEHYPKYEQSNISLSIVISSLLVGVLWSVQLVYLFIRAIKK